MSGAERLIAAAARTLPRAVRERYREEWQADLAGTRELGLPPRMVVGGALATALTIDRTDPRVTGIPKARLVGVRMRWAAAFLGSAAVLGVGNFLWGGHQTLLPAPLSVGLQALVLIFATLGLFASVGALVIAFEAHGRKAALLLGLGAVGIVTVMIGVMLLPIIGVLGALAALAVVVIVMAGGVKERTAPRAPRTAYRPLLAIPFTVLTLLTIAVGILHIAVWNPLARVPGRSLDEIYAAMAAANETPVVGMIVVWAATWAGVAVALPVLCALPRLAGFFTARRILVAGLLVVGLAASFHWLAGFNMGMSLADTFMTSGGDAAVSGPLIGLSGLVALVAAMLIGLTPQRGAEQPPVVKTP